MATLQQFQVNPLDVFTADQWRMVNSAVERYVGEGHESDVDEVETLHRFVAYYYAQACRLERFVDEESGCALGDGVPPAGGEREPIDPLAALDR